MALRILLVTICIVITTISYGQKGKWENAKRANTVEAYETFLSKYPESEFSAEARSSIEKLKYDEVRQKDQLLLYQRFISEYPESGYKADVVERINKKLLEAKQIPVKYVTLIMLQSTGIDTEVDSRLLGSIKEALIQKGLIVNASLYYKASDKYNTLLTFQVGDSKDFDSIVRIIKPESSLRIDALLFVEPIQSVVPAGSTITMELSQYYMFKNPGSQYVKMEITTPADILLTSNLNDDKWTYSDFAYMAKAQFLIPRIGAVFEAKLYGELAGISPTSYRSSLSDYNAKQERKYTLIENSKYRIARYIDNYITVGEN